MGFKALTAKLAQVAVGIVGDLAVSVTYTFVSGLPTYDVASDSITKTSSTATFKGVLTSRSDNEYDYAKMQDDHLKLIVATADMPAGATPASEDTCVINGRGYEVKRIKYVPGDPIYIIYLQAN